MYDEIAYQNNKPLLSVIPINNIVPRRNCLNIYALDQTFLTCFKLFIASKISILRKLRQQNFFLHLLEEVNLSFVNKIVIIVTKNVKRQI